MSVNMRAAALALARDGWAVFPVWHVLPNGSCACGDDARGQIGKHPRCNGGHTAASLEPDDIETWWSSGEDAPPGFGWECDPSSNIGLAIPDGFVFVDIDPRNGGIETYDAIADWPDTLTVISGSGGLHHVYRTPPGMKYPKTLDALGKGKGIDIKQLGGYVLAAPSNHKSGGTYQWHEPRAAIVDAPAWLLALGRVREKQAHVERRERDYVEMTDTARAQGDAIVTVLEPAYVEGKRHHIARALGTYLKQKMKSFELAEYVISQLPSESTSDRIIDVEWGYEHPQADGWSTLKEAFDTPESLKAFELSVKRRPPIKVTAPVGIGARLRNRDPGNAVHFPTGIPSFDAMLSFGGLLATKRLVIGGAPDAGKTALAVQLAAYFASKGIAVAWVAVDEDVDDIDTRRVQHLGCKRLVAQGVLPEEWLQRVETELEPHVFDVFENIPVDGVIESMAARYPDKRIAVFGDSLQTMHSTQSILASDRRAQVDTLISDIKTAQLKHPCLLVLTSEMNRSAYRSKKASENVDAMASSKESGAIEYMATLYMALRSLGNGIVEVEIAKNKMGKKGKFKLKLDESTLLFGEAPAEADEEENDDVKIVREIYAAVKKGDAYGRPTEEIIAEIGGNDKREKAARALLKNEAAAGRLVACKGHRNAINYKAKE